MHLQTPGQLVQQVGNPGLDLAVEGQGAVQVEDQVLIGSFSPLPGMSIWIMRLPQGTNELGDE